MSVVMHLISDEKCTVVYTCCRDGGNKGCDRERKTSKNSSISHQLFGTQDEDDTIRFVVSNMVSRNKEIFLPFFIPTANINSLDQHCARMWISGTWATLVEVVAAATVFMIPVYFVTQSREGYR